MTPNLSIRSFTNDQYILDKVFYANFYRIKGFKDAVEKPVVLDIGAHCGYFTFAALALGAKKVFSFEPFLDNYKQLIKNVNDERLGEVVSYQMGIYTTDVRLTFGYPELQKGSFFDFANIGENFNVSNQRVFAAPCLSLDNALQNYIAEPIDILKICIGYAEMSVLLASKLIQTQVKSICGEAEIDLANQAQFKVAMANKGFIYGDYFPLEAEEDNGKVLFQFSKSPLEETFEQKGHQ